jgi:hypothetical protein
MVDEGRTFSNKNRFDQLSNNHYRLTWIAEGGEVMGTRGAIERNWKRGVCKARGCGVRA